MKDCCVTVLTKTWLSNGMPDFAFQLDDRMFFRSDHDQLSGKTTGGGICIYVNKGWCTNCLLVGRHCSEAVEYLIIKCWPHYLLHEFTAVVIAAVYIPPDANANAALNKLHEAINLLQNKYPEALYVAAGDFNHVNLQVTLPTFHQHVTIATRDDNTLDKVYSNRQGTYRADPHPHLGASNHISIMLVPAYCPVTKRMTATQKTITVWPAEAVPMLKDCFETTDWQMFKEAVTEGNTVNLEEYSESVLAYIAKCVEDVTTTKTITISPHQKPRLNAEVHRLLRIRDAAAASRGCRGTQSHSTEPYSGSQETKVHLCSKDMGSFLI